MGTSVQRLVLVDAFAILFRAFYAIPHMNAPSGEPTNAVYGFTRILMNVIDELKPDCMAIAFDSEGPTFRDEIFEAYKANREAPPDDFIPQIGLTTQVVDALSIPRFEIKGWEADDIIGTLAEQASSTKEQDTSNKIETVIVTGDQDLFQLVDDQKQIKVWIPGMRGKESVMYNEAGVIDKLKVKNTQVADYKGLAGDASDNIPGIKGIGPKTAVGILQRYDSIDNLYQILENDLGEESDLDSRFTIQELREKAKELGLGAAVLKKLVEGKSQAFLSRDLATISKQARISLDLNHCKINIYDKEKVRDIFQHLGFKSLMHLLPDDEFEMDVQEALF